MEGQHLGNINPETQDELKKFFKRSPVEYDPSYDYNLDYGDSEPQLSIAMANRSKLDYGMVMPRDTKTLRTLCNIFIYSAVKLDIPKSESLGSFSFRDREAAEKAKEEVDAAGLNGVQGLSWRSRMVVLRSIFAGEDAEDVWPRVYEHGKGVAEWMRGPLSEGTNRNYDPLGEMGDAVEMLLYQPTLSKFNESYVAARKDGWILDHDTDVGSKCLYDGVSRGVAVRYIGAGWYGCRPGSRTDLLVLGFKDFYWVDTGSRGVEDFLGDADKVEIDYSQNYCKDGFLRWYPGCISPIPACEHCRRMKDDSVRKLLTCSRCQVAKYCSRECQKANWKAHKLTCLPPPPTFCPLQRDYD
ncbi:hypothetical protein TrVE_jg8876 [Triparma verrucosa]|uniref:MYND-type domain-containing protein n=1 Tax=Triparma verrucosa TaxID=1606542 RepID=A0A9W7BWI3_9STRA|nr:hypothetical protein TrVE_jg8876 [Triparma verrucosa]